MKNIRKLKSRKTTKGKTYHKKGNKSILDPYKSTENYKSKDLDWDVIIEGYRKRFQEYKNQGRRISWQLVMKSTKSIFKSIFKKSWRYQAYTRSRKLNIRKTKWGTQRLQPFSTHDVYNVYGEWKLCELSLTAVINTNLKVYELFMLKKHNLFSWFDINSQSLGQSLSWKSKFLLLLKCESI